MGLFKQGWSRRDGDMSLPEYQTESQSFRLWAIRGLTEGGRSLEGRDGDWRTVVDFQKNPEWNVGGSLEHSELGNLCSLIIFRDVGDSKPTSQPVGI